MATPILAALLALGGCGRGQADTAPAQPAGAAKSNLDKGASAEVPVDHHILVDQFGYRPGDPKVAVIRDPKAGYDRSDSFSPGASYQLRRADDGEAVFSGAPAAWKSGAVESSSGDRGWWFDFSSVSTPGRYFVYDVDKKLRSPTFAIDPQPYKNVLKAAVRTFFYQRAGFAKKPPYAEACWTDTVAYAGKNQDTEAHDVTDRGNADKVKDLSGGWFDAGDTNKYVTFAVQPVHQLLAAYQQSPTAFTDDFNIPESGNGIPDVVDEVKWETDWLKKMQYADGSLALKVGAIEYVGSSPPSSDKSPRFYVPACSSATIAGAGMFAHAAYVYGAFPALSADADDLKKRALDAWKNYQGVATKQTGCDTGVVKAGNADRNQVDQQSLAVEAAVYLFAITGDEAYEKYVAAHYKEMRPYRDNGWSRYDADQGEALLFYTTLPKADPALKKTILSDKRKDAEAGNQIYGFDPRDDLYRAFLHDPQYHWGSNNPRANYGNSNVDVVAYNVGASNPEKYQTRAVEILHYFHGVNPLAMVYLSNMYALGATTSANEIYHTWFAANTKWSNAKTSSCGPAPGYVPGGPNASAEKDGVPAKLAPPTGQPPQKSYKDWNGNWPESSWAVTEPAIYYQSAYVRLLAAFAQSK